MKALVLVSTGPGKVEAVQKKVKAIKGVRDALLVTGRADVAVFLEGSLQQVGGVVKSIWDLPGVVTTETLLGWV